MVTPYSKYTAHISSNGSNFLTAWFLVSNLEYGQTKLTAHISSNEIHILMAWFLMTEHIRPENWGTIGQS